MSLFLERIQANNWNNSTPNSNSNNNIFNKQDKILNFSDTY